MTLPASTADLVIEVLVEHHEVKKFRCRENDLAVYLKFKAKPSTEIGYGLTYVAVEPGQARVWAYYTLSNASLDVSNFPNPLENAPASIPAIRIGRMAKDRTCPADDVGGFLLGHAFKMIIEAAKRSAVFCVVLEAKNDSLKRKFYRPLGFMELNDDPLHLYLPISEVRKFVTALEHDNPA